MDLLSLTVSMAMQSEMKELRNETGAAFNDNVEVAEESTMSQVAEVVESGLNAIESAVSTVASAMTPSGAMVESVMPSAAYLEMDLSMPTSSTAKAC